MEKEHEFTYNELAKIFGYETKKKDVIIPCVTKATVIVMTNPTEFMISPMDRYSEAIRHSMIAHAALEDYKNNRKR